MTSREMLRADRTIPTAGATAALLDVTQVRHESIELVQTAFFGEACGQIVREEAILLAGAPGANKEHAGAADRRRYGDAREARAAGPDRRVAASPEVRRPADDE